MLVLILSPYTVDSATEKPVVYFGIYQRYRPDKMYERFQPLMDYLSSATPYQFELKICLNDKDGLKLLAENKIQVAILEDAGTMQAIIRYGAVPVVRPLNKLGSATRRSVIIVPKQSRIGTMHDLNGKRIALGKYHSETENLLPRSMLAETGVKLATLTNLSNRQAVLNAVLRGDFDAGSVEDEDVDRLNNKGFRIIATSRPVPSDPIVVANGVDPVVVSSVAKALLKLDCANPAQQKQIKIWDDEFRYGYSAASISDYRTMARQYRTRSFGCGVGCHR